MDDMTSALEGISAVAISATTEETAALDKFAKKAKYITLNRHILDMFKAYADVCDQGEISEWLGITSGWLKTFSGIADIYLGNEKLGTNEDFKGVLEIITGVGKIASAFGNPYADIVYGSTTFTSVLNDILQEKLHTSEEKAEAWSKIFSGVSRALAGVFKVCPPFAPLAIPFGLAAGTFSYAGMFFREEKWLEGVLTLCVGAVAITGICLLMKSVLTIAFTALMDTIMTAFGTLSASVSAAVASIPPLLLIATPILAWIAYEIIAALASAPPTYAQGGFPDTDQTFIAREAGPELVGRLNGRTAVVNHDQIVEAVSRGVYGAFQSALCNESSHAPAIARVYLDGKQIAMAG